jgi:hypothetical protein
MVKRISFYLGTGLIVLGVISCKGAAKQDIPLSAGQTYVLQSSGKLTAYPSGSKEAGSEAAPLEKLRVKRKNEGPGSKAEGCWHCSDCICNSADCSCTECTSC